MVLILNCRAVPHPVKSSDQDSVLFSGTKRKCMSDLSSEAFCRQDRSSTHCLVASLGPVMLLCWQHTHGLQEDLWTAPENVKRDTGFSISRIGCPNSSMLALDSLVDCSKNSSPSAEAHRRIQPLCSLLHWPQSVFKLLAAQREQTSGPLEGTESKRNQQSCNMAKDEKWQHGSRREWDHCFFSLCSHCSFSSLGGVPHSFPTSCSLNGKAGAAEAHLHSLSLPVTPMLLAVELQRPRVPPALYSKRSLWSSSNTQYSLAEAEKGLKSTALADDARAHGRHHTWRMSFHKAGNKYQKLPLARSGLENTALSQVQKCTEGTEVFYLRRAMASTPLSRENKTLLAHTVAAFPVHWPEHAITAP